MKSHGNRVFWPTSAWHPPAYARPLHQHQPGRSLVVLRSLFLLAAAVTVAALQGPSPPAASWCWALCTWTLQSAWACMWAVPPMLQLVFSVLEWQALGPSTPVLVQGTPAAQFCSWVARFLLCVGLPYVAAHLRWLPGKETSNKDNCTHAVSSVAGRAASGLVYNQEQQQAGLNQAATKQLSARSLGPAAGVTAGQAPPPMAYTPMTCMMAVSMKVDAPHEQLQEVGSSLVGSLGRVLAGGAATAPGQPNSAWLGSAAVFAGCVQLIANLFAARQQPQQSAAADGVPRTMGQPGSAHTASRDAGPDSRRWGLAAALVQDAVDALWKGGVRPSVAASADGQLVVARPAAQGSTAACTPAEVQQGVWPAVPLVALDPPCTTAAAAGTQELYVGLKSSRLQGSCQQGRLVVCGPRGVVLDQQPLQWVGSIRFELPELPVGVCQLALLPVASSTAPEALAAACRPLLCEALLVLPAPVASELQQYWRSVLGAVAAGAPLSSFIQASPVRTAGAAEADAAAVAAAGVRAGIPADGSGQCKAFVSIMSHAWMATMSGLVSDLTYVVLASLGPDTHTTSGVIEMQQLQWLVEVSDAGLSQQQLPVVKEVAQHLLQHLILQGLVQTAAFVEAAAANAEAALLSRQSALARATAAAAPTPALRMSSEDVAGSDVAAAPGRVSECSLSRAVSVEHRQGSLAGSGSSSSEASSRSQEPFQVPAQVEAAADAGGVAGRHGLAQRWLPMLQLLAYGFQPPALELAYMEEMYRVSFMADVFGAVFLFPVALSFGTLTDPYPSGFTVCDLARRLLFMALFGVPKILLLAFRQRLRHGDRRERAQLLVDWCGVGAAWMMPLGVLPVTPGLARILAHNLRNWFIVVVGVGAFMATQRQARTRKVLLPALLDIAGWFAAASANGELLWPTLLRFASGAAVSMLLNVVLELRSRKRFLEGLRCASTCSVQGLMDKGGSSRGVWPARHSSSKAGQTTADKTE